MILSTHGIVASQIVQGYDSDAQAFFDRVDTAGGTLSLTEKNAVNTLVVKMKNDGIWTKMKAIYPMVGASADSCKQNLKSSSFTGSFSSGWTFSSTGAKPNGTSAYMNSGLNANTQLNVNSSHLSYYARNLNTSIGFNVFLGIGSTSCYMQGSNNTVINARQASDGTSSLSDTPIGFLIGNKQNSTTQQSYKNNLRATLIVTTTSFSTTSQNIFVGNYDTQGIFGTNSECAFASIGDGLTNTEASNFYTAVQAFQTTLSRQV